MGFLVLSILCNALIYLIFRFIGKQYKKQPLFPVIVVNYWTAAAISLVVFLLTEPFRFPAEALVYELSVVMGVLFVSGFYFLGRTTQAYGVASANIIVRTSLIIPALFSIFQYEEPITKGKVVGIFLALLAIFFTIRRTPQRSSTARKALDYAMGAFLTAGLIDVVLKLIQNEVLEPTNVSPTVMTLFIFAFAAIIGTFILVAWVGTSSLTPTVIRQGVFLGVVNFGSIYFFLRLLEDAAMQGSILFPLNGVAIVVLSTLLAWFALGELPRGKQWTGIILGLLAIGLLAGAHVFGI